MTTCASPLARGLAGSILSAALIAPVAAQTVPAAGLRLWLQGDAGVTLNGASVVRWADQSGQGNDLTAPAGSGPTLNGCVRTAVSFNGVQQMSGSLGAGNLQAASVFSIIRYTVSSSDTDYLYAIGSPGQSGSQICASRRNGDRPYHFDGSIENVSSTTSIAPDSWRIFTQVVGDQSPTAHRWSDQDGSLLTSSATNPYSALPSMVLGNWSSGAFFMVGDVHELLVYDRVLSVTDEQAVESYLAQRLASLTSSPAAAIRSVAAPQDLSTWTVEQYDVGCQPAAQWMVGADPTVVQQPINADPSIYLSEILCADSQISVECVPGTGPDYAGVVFGYQDRGHFYLLEWRRTTLNYACGGGTANVGVTLRVINTPSGVAEPTGQELWLSPATSASTTVLRESVTPWVVGRRYILGVAFRPGSFGVRIEEVGATSCQAIVDWEVSDSTYLNGRFGLWLHSQQQAEFRNVRVDALPFASGCGAAGTRPALLASTAFLGANWELRVEGVTPLASGVVLLGGVPPVPISLGTGCELGVSPASLFLPVAADGMGNWAQAFPLPGLPLAGLSVGLQAVVAPSAGPLLGDLTNSIVTRFQ